MNQNSLSTVQRYLDDFEALLGDNEWVAGTKSPTVADINLLCTTDTAQVSHQLLCSKTYHSVEKEKKKTQPLTISTKEKSPETYHDFDSIFFWLLTIKTAFKFQIFLEHEITSRPKVHAWLNRMQKWATNNIPAYPSLARDAANALLKKFKPASKM